MIKVCTTFLLLFYLTFGYSQNKGKALEKINGVNGPSERVRDAIVDNELTVQSYGCKYIDQDIYIINHNHIIYENCKERKYLNAHMPSFMIPTYNESGFFALDKNGVYFRGKFVKTDTTGFKVIGAKNYNSELIVLWKTK